MQRTLDVSAHGAGSVDDASSRLPRSGEQRGAWKHTQPPEVCGVTWLAYEVQAHYERLDDHDNQLASHAGRLSALEGAQAGVAQDGADGNGSGKVGGDGDRAMPAPGRRSYREFGAQAGAKLRQLYRVAFITPAGRCGRSRVTGR